MESIIVNNIRWEIEVNPTLGRQLIMEGDLFYCAMWQTEGIKRTHLYSIKYGKTEIEAREAMNETIKILSRNNL